MVDIEGGVRQRLLSLCVNLPDFQVRFSAVCHSDLGVGGGSRIIRVDINAVFRGIKDVSGGGGDLLHGVMALGNVGHGGNAVVVGGHGGNQGPVPVYLKGRTGQAAEVIRIALVENQGRLADIAESEGHVVSAIPVHSLFLRIQFISFGCGDLVDFIAAQGQCVGVKLNHAGMIRSPGGVKAAVDLLERDHGALQAVSVLRIDLADGQGFLAGVLYGHIIGLRCPDGYIHCFSNIISVRSLSFCQGILYIRIQTGPEDAAASVGCTGNRTAVGAGERKLCAFQRLPTAADFSYLEFSGFSLLTAPSDHGICCQRAFTRISNNIALLCRDIIVGQIDLILHHMRPGVYDDLTAVGSGFCRDTELCPPPILKAVIIDVGGVDDSRDTPCRVVLKAAPGQFLIVFIYKKCAAWRSIRPNLNVIV